MLNLALAAALLVPQEAPTQTPAETSTVPASAATQSPAEQILDRLFPAPSGPMTLVAGDSENPLTYAALVKQYGALTGQYFVVSDEVKSILNMNLNLDRTMTVPTEEVQSVFEQLLKHGEFSLHPLTTDGTRIIELSSLLTAARNNLRSRAIFLGPDEIHLAAEHPALLFTASVELPHVDVRQVSNSMRTMITDANTQQMLPAGNSSTMIIVGFGDQVHGMVQTLKNMDAAAASGAAGIQQASEVIRMVNGNAVQIADIMSRAYAKPEGSSSLNDPRFAADTRTNSILVTARSRDIETLRVLIAALDIKKQ